MFQFIGLGACGAKITLLAEKYLSGIKGAPMPLYINFDSTDFKEVSEVQKQRKLLLEGSGTGRSPEKGLEFAEKHRKEIKEFLFKSLGIDKDNNGKPSNTIILVFGAGGGTGSGLAPVVADLLLKEDLQVGIAMTFPEDKSDLLENKNAITTLNKIMDISSQLTPFILIDNQYLLNTLKVNGRDFWKNINTYIVNAFLSMTELFETDPTKLVSSNRGISNLDLAELKRVFQTPGFTDVRTIGIPEVVFKQFGNTDLRLNEFGLSADEVILRKQALFQEKMDKFRDKIIDSFKHESLCGKFKLQDTLTYACVAIVNEDFDQIDRVQDVFNIVASMNKNSGIRRTGTIFKSKVATATGQGEFSDLKIVKFVFVASGYKMPNEVNKKVSRIKRDAVKFNKAKTKESKANIKDPEALNVDVFDDFKV
jgi:cell division GTPase FtsZ